MSLSPAGRPAERGSRGQRPPTENLNDFPLAGEAGGIYYMISLMRSRRPGRLAEKQLIISLVISLMISRWPGRPAENN